MGSWRAVAFFLGAASHACAAFVPTFLGEIWHPPTYASPLNPLGTRIESGGIRIGVHDCIHRHAGLTAPLMMAKERKKRGKGKAGRVDLIERYGREGKLMSSSWERCWYVSKEPVKVQHEQTSFRGSLLPSPPHPAHPSLCKTYVYPCKHLTQRVGGCLLCGGDPCNPAAFVEGRHPPYHTIKRLWYRSRLYWLK